VFNNTIDIFKVVKFLFWKGFAAKKYKGYHGYKSYN